MSKIQKPNIIVWDDDQGEADTLCQFFIESGYKAKAIVKSNFDDFEEALDLDFDCESSLNYFHSKNIIVSDLLLDNSAADSSGKSVPFRHLASKIKNRYPLVCYSSLSKRPDLVGRDFYNNKNLKKVSRKCKDTLLRTIEMTWSDWISSDFDNNQIEVPMTNNSSELVLVESCITYLYWTEYQNRRKNWLTKRYGLTELPDIENTEKYEPEVIEWWYERLATESIKEWSKSNVLTLRKLSESLWEGKIDSNCIKNYLESKGESALIPDELELVLHDIGNLPHKFRAMLSISNCSINKATLESSNVYQEYIELTDRVESFFDSSLNVEKESQKETVRQLYLCKTKKYFSNKLDTLNQLISRNSHFNLFSSPNLEEKLFELLFLLRKLHSSISELKNEVCSKEVVTVLFIDDEWANEKSSDASPSAFLEQYGVNEFNQSKKNDVYLDFIFSTGQKGGINDWSVVENVINENIDKIDRIVLDVNFKEKNNFTNETNYWGLELYSKIKEQYAQFQDDQIIILTSEPRNKIEKIFRAKSKSHLFKRVGDHTKAIPKSTFFYKLLSILNLDANELTASYPENLIVESDEMKLLYSQARSYSQTSETIYISGETGSGKEVVAKFIHLNSGRPTEIWNAVNCKIFGGDINISKAELFGVEAGINNATTEDKKGLFEVSNGGTLFLDEIAELSDDTQALLLRVLDYGEFSSVGSSRVKRTNVRVICGTNESLKNLTATRQFREDLYERLRGFELEVPPLRKRQADLKALLKVKIEEPLAANDIFLAESAKQELLNFHYPRNVRQFCNLAKKIVIDAYQRDLESGCSLVTKVEILKYLENEGIASKGINRQVRKNDSGVVNGESINNFRSFNSEIGEFEIKIDDSNKSLTLDETLFLIKDYSPKYDEVTGSYEYIRLACQKILLDSMVVIHERHAATNIAEIFTANDEEPSHPVVTGSSDFIKRVKLLGLSTRPKSDTIEGKIISELEKNPKYRKLLSKARK
ncbi:MAG: sigma-54-dependent Fis family transcriptional regulator [Colwellia sp.]|nr:sigma-54-dependent Fis family transcriptional regulator [Colwellia sp.]